FARCIVVSDSRAMRPVIDPPSLLDALPIWRRGPAGDQARPLLDQRLGVPAGMAENAMGDILEDHGHRQQFGRGPRGCLPSRSRSSEEHTPELQSRIELVYCLPLTKKKKER